MGFSWTPTSVTSHIAECAPRRAGRDPPGPASSTARSPSCTAPTGCAFNRTKAERCLQSASGHDAAAQPRHGDDAHIHQRKYGG